MQNKGFLGSLFDLSFSEFVTTRIIKLLFILAILVSGLSALFILIRMFSVGFGRGLLGLIVAPILFLLSVLISRIWLEVVIVLFRIAENTGRLVDQGKTIAAPPPPSE